MKFPGNKKAFVVSIFGKRSSQSLVRQDLLYVDIMIAVTKIILIQGATKRKIYNLVGNINNDFRMPVESDDYNARWPISW